MKNWVKIGLGLLAVLSMGLTVLLSSPADAMMPKYERLVAMGIVDEIATPHELGLDYLEREPVELATTPELMNSIQYVNEQFAIMPEDINVKFPLGTTSPIRIGDIPNDPGTPPGMSNHELIGYVDNEGKSKTFKARDGKVMTGVEYRNGGNITMTPEAQYIMVADAKGLLAQEMREPEVTIIVRNRQNNRRFLIPRANLNAICRDALNGVLNQSLIRY